MRRGVNLKTKDGHCFCLGDYIKIPYKDLIETSPLIEEQFYCAQDKDGNILFLVNNVSSDELYLLLVNDHKGIYQELYVAVGMVERCGEYVGRTISEVKNDCGEVVSRVIAKEDIADLDDKTKTTDELYNSTVSSIMRNEADNIMGCGVKHISEVSKELREIIDENNKKQDCGQDNACEANLADDTKKNLKCEELKYAVLSNSGDRVNHPSHYTWLKDSCGVEVIDITRHLDFDLGNAIKYLLRAGKKSEEGYSDKEKELQDLRKAAWYVEDKIKMLEKDLEQYNVE